MSEEISTSVQEQGTPTPNCETAGDDRENLASKTEFTDKLVFSNLSVTDKYVHHLYFLECRSVHEDIRAKYMRRP